MGEQPIVQSENSHQTHDDETNQGKCKEFKQKCKDLRRKVEEVEENNKIASLAINRTNIGIKRLRLEYSILLERLERSIDNRNISDVEDSYEDFELVEFKKHPPKKKKTVSSHVNSRDPDMPKRPLNPYLVFCEMEKESFRKEAEAEGRQIDLSRTLGEAWKQLDDEARKPYYDKYSEDKERYAKEMAAYENNKPKSSAAKQITTGSPPRLDQTPVSTVIPTDEVQAEAAPTEELPDVSSETFPSENTAKVLKSVDTEKTEDQEDNDQVDNDTEPAEEKNDHQ